MMATDRPFNKTYNLPHPIICRRSFLTSAVAGVAVSSMTSPFERLAAETRHRGINRLPSVEEIRASDESMWKLVDLINAYRRQNGLPVVPLSPRLSAVAALHARDLAVHQPHVNNGSLHSWSTDGRWTGGAYNAKDKESWPIMWDKPKEIAAYDGYGFEVAAADTRDVPHALALWRRSKSHNDVLLNREVWAKKRWQWQAMGAVFYKGYACAWFGDKPDE